MTDKQIIIDCSYKGECQIMGCINDDTCFIKQLFEERNRAEKELYSKEQECEELKEKYKWFDHYKEQALYNKNLCNEQFNELTRFKKENKKLKKENKDWQKEVERVQFIGSYGIMDEVKKNTQLKQTLAEIKHEAKCGWDMFMERGKYEDYEAMAEWMKNQFYFILQKINEVEDE